MMMAPAAIATRGKTAASAFCRVKGERDEAALREPEPLPLLALPPLPLLPRTGVLLGTGEFPSPPVYVAAGLPEPTGADEGTNVEVCESELNT